MPEKSIVVHERMPPPARRIMSLVLQLAPAGKSQATRLIREGAVAVNGRVVRRGDLTLEVGDRLDVLIPVERGQAAARDRGDARSFHIVYEDTDLIVVDKPPRLLTVPTPRGERNTLVSLVTSWLRQHGTGTEAFCVHRLDRGVSGLLVFGKRLEIAQRLRDQFEARKPARRYVAIVSGVVRRREGTFRSYLATDKKTLSQFSTTDEQVGQLAITHYRVAQVGETSTLVHVTLETGRRNQIRVHFAEAGHPVLGDTRYGRMLPDTAEWPHHRLALHAQSLGFEHPISGQPLEFQSRLPREFDWMAD